MKNLTYAIFFSLSLLFLLPSSVFAVATMADYWQGKAEWKLVNAITIGNTGWEYGYGAGAHIRIVDNIWYLFGRRYFWGQAPNCPGGEPMGIVVRKSTDEGKTWSEQVDIISPLQPGSPWECAGIDGDAFYNAGENKWHYLFQCMAPGGPWNACHVEKGGIEPMGLFQQGSNNPVITGGPSERGLWKNICTDSSKDCYNISGGNHVYDAGTFDIFDYSGGYYWVSFHGYDGVANGEHAYRGIAKTTNFVNWIAGDVNQGVPADAVLDKNDALNFRESWQGEPKGFLAGNIFPEGSYYYLISEVPDISTNCTDGQNWDWGLFRSNSLTNTKWESFPLGNPFLYSSKKGERGGKSIGCNPGYGRIFKDPGSGKIYFNVTRESVDNNFSGIYLYELVESNNLLQNGNLWKCNTDNWEKTSPGAANIIAYRYPHESSDANCFLSLSCTGNRCDPGQSIYQDADVGSIPYRNISYGGKFAVETGSGNLLLNLSEFDSSGALINETKTNLAPDTNYQSSNNQITLKDATKKVRFAVYLISSNNFKADEMFVEPISSFSSPTKAETCSVSAPSSVPPGSPFNISFSGFADDSIVRTENLWIERSDGGLINPSPPGSTLIQSGNLNYYKLTNCQSSNSPCYGSLTTELPAGSYVTHCDSNGRNKCSGNPFCDYNGGSVNCTATGWRDCSDTDSQVIKVGGVLAPKVTSVFFNGGASSETAKSLDLTGKAWTTASLNNNTGNTYSATIEVTITTGDTSVATPLIIKFLTSASETPQPSPEDFETGIEAGEQHDTGRVPLVAETGAKWVRLNFIGSNWNEGSGDVTKYNSIINAYLNQNIKIIGLIGAQSVSGGFNRQNPAAFIPKFTQAADDIIGRFGDRVKVYELFNEPNDWAGGTSSQVPERYFAQVLADIFRKVKIEKQRKEIHLNSGPLLSHDQNSGAAYLQETYSQGRGLGGNLNWETIKNQTGSYPLDGVGYHIYVAQGMGDQAQVESKILANLNAMKSVIDTLDPGKKLWITEIGWGTGAGRISEETQASNLEKAYTVMSTHSAVKLGMWFTLIDFDASQWGLLRANETKKPAWFVFKQFATKTPSISPSPSGLPTASPGPSSPPQSPVPSPSFSQSPGPTLPPQNEPDLSDDPGMDISPPAPRLSQGPEVRVVLVASAPLDPSGQSPLSIRLAGEVGKSSSVLVPVAIAYTEGSARHLALQFNYLVNTQSQRGGTTLTSRSGRSAVIPVSLVESKYDLNGDKLINSVDITVFFNNWRAKLKGGSATAGDFNRDGVINSIDFAILKSQMGKKAG